MQKETLYPLQFVPIPHLRIWGGHKLAKNFHKPFDPNQKIGESWEISDIEGSESVVSDGHLKGNTLPYLISIYKGKLLGQRVFAQHRSRFPLLIKYIDADALLSVQVHPDDKLAQERHQSMGKTEMWYIMQHEPDASLLMGFTRDIDAEEYKKAIASGTLQNIVGEQKVEREDVYYIPAGRIHAIGAGIVLAEIQQSSDVTYRVYDWNRTDDQGNSRELHTEEAVEALDFSATADHSKTSYQTKQGEASEIVRSPYFLTQVLEITRESPPLIQELHPRDSFTIYMCVEGEAVLQHLDTKTILRTGQTILVPAILSRIQISSHTSSCRLLDISMP